MCSRPTSRSAYRPRDTHLMSEAPGRAPVVVYLDQNQWIKLAQARFSPQKILSAHELGAADAVLRAMEAGTIAVPLANAHLVETAHAGTGQRRKQLADTMLNGYGGWHMRHPLDVRRHELIDVLQRHRGLTSSPRLRVFSRAPGTPFPEREAGQLFQASREFSDSDHHFIEYRSWRARFNWRLARGDPARTGETKDPLSARSPLAAAQRPRSSRMAD